MIGVQTSPEYSCIRIILPNSSSRSLSNEIITTISFHRRFHIVLEVAVALQYLHERSPPYIHGDINPMAVRLSDDGSVKLSLFGAPKIFAAVGPLQRIRVLYTTPEVINEEELEPTIYADSWSLGCTLLQILAGITPWAESKGEVIKTIIGLAKGRMPANLDQLNLSPKANELLKRCWSHEASDRPSMRQCVEQLQDILHSLEKEEAG